MPRKTRGRASRKIVAAARAQRRRPTPAEAKLWAALRGRQFAGLKFRRNHPFDRFVLDAFCVEHQIEVEVDGEIHANPKQAAYDVERTACLAERGIRVLRFRNQEIEADLDRVLRRIAEAVGLPHLAEPPAGAASLSHPIASQTA
jgi:very-short-patch-repair endonuclease